jgi:hypothetical protein
MSWKKFLGLASSAALSSAVVVLANGCSSSNSNTGGSDSGATDALVHKETAPSGDDSGGEAGPPTFDGTTGKQCTSDTDCNGGAGLNKCSSDYQFTVTGVPVALWPTPVCIPPLVQGSPGNCDPCGGGACDANAIWGCDSANLDPTTSPGLCLANTPQNPAPGQGVCVPRCQFKLDGSAPTGCAAKDRCVQYTFLLDPTSNTVTGIGFCQGACESDADCSGLGTGFKCQVDIGFCTKTPKTRTKTIGQGCTGGSATTSDTSTGACNCVANNTTNVGYCSSSCIVGSVACPNGYVCDGLYPSGPLNFGDASAPAVAQQNTGVVGQCFQPCTAVDAGTAADGGPECPTNSTCQLQTIVGPDCLP